MAIVANAFSRALSKLIFGTAVVGGGIAAHKLTDGKSTRVAAATATDVFTETAGGVVDAVTGRDPSKAKDKKDDDSMLPDGLSDWLRDKAPWLAGGGAVLGLGWLFKDKLGGMLMSILVTAAVIFGAGGLLKKAFNSAAKGDEAAPAQTLSQKTTLDVQAIKDDPNMVRMPKPGEETNQAQPKPALEVG